MDILILFVAFAWIIFIISLFKSDKIIGFLAGCFFLVIGIWGYIYGIGVTNNLMTQAFAYIHIGVGAICVIIAGYEMIEEMQDGADIEEISEEDD